MSVCVGRCIIHETRDSTPDALQYGKFIELEQHTHTRTNSFIVFK